jgi:ATP-dependent exoDNAse (exonuclease V) beta subunit
MQLGEEKRLLYVGFTRAKDAVVTVAEDTAPGVIAACCPTARKADTAPSGGKVDIWGLPAHKCTYLEMEDDPTLHSSLQVTNETYRDAGLSLKGKAAPAPQKYVSPSLYEDPAAMEKAEVTCLKDFGHRTDIPHPSMEDNVFGDLVHHVFAACVQGDDEANRAAAERTLKAFGIADVEGAGKLADCIGELYGWLEQTYGPATQIERELPFRYGENGRVFSGNMDMVWQTEDGCVLVDYKTFPGRKADLFDKGGQHWAGGYASQLGVYSRALKARDGKEPLASVLYYPVEGLVLSV